MTKETLGYLVLMDHLARKDLREIEEHLDLLELMEFKGQRVFRVDQDKQGLKVTLACLVLEECLEILVFLAYLDFR